MSRLLLATTSRDKIAEISLILRDAPVELETLDAHPAIEPPDETGRTFAENARHKALYYGDCTGRVVVADDSGLEIDALDGRPGIHSARLLGPDAPYPERFRAIYRMLDERGARNSPARFVTALALVRRGEVVFEAHGTIEGRIAPAPRGTGGFGYDPIFHYPPYGSTLAEVSRERKSAVSHRGAAFRQLRGLLADRRFRIE